MKNLNSITPFNSVKKVKNNLLSSKSLEVYSLYSQVKLVKKLQCSLKIVEKIKVCLDHVLSSANVEHSSKTVKSVKNLTSLTKKITLLQRSSTGAKKSNVYFSVYSMKVLV